MEDIIADIEENFVRCSPSDAADHLEFQILILVILNTILERTITCVQEELANIENILGDKLAKVG